MHICFCVFTETLLNNSQQKSTCTYAKYVKQKTSSKGWKGLTKISETYPFIVTYPP